MWFALQAAVTLVACFGAACIVDFAYRVPPRGR
jgi:hypothetical protein